MGQVDTERENWYVASEDIAGDIDSEMQDHEMLLHHVTQHDAELYALDCSLCDLFR